MTAQQAKEAANSSNENDRKAQMNAILEKIAEAATGGNYQVLTSSSLRHDVELELIEAGYKIYRPSSFGDESVVKIMWG